MSTKPKSDLCKENRCEECEEQVHENYDIDEMDGFEVIICCVCNGSCEPCQECGSRDVVYSDYGVNLCGPCKKNSTPEQKAWLYRQEYSDALESGHPMADDMPMPSDWR